VPAGVPVFPPPPPLPLPPQPMAGRKMVSRSVRSPARRARRRVRPARNMTRPIKVSSAVAVHGERGMEPRAKPPELVRAVVAKETVWLTAAVPESVKVAGAVQVTPVGAVPCAVQVVEMAALNPFSGVKTRVAEPGEPAVAVTVVVGLPALSVRVKSGVAGVVPVPVRVAVTGLVLTLVSTENDPVRLPAAVGLKTTLAVQDAPGARVLGGDVAPQLLVWEKSPVVEMLDMVKDASPVFEMVNTCAAEVAPISVLEKVALAGDTNAERTGGGMVK